jgi:uncharacterized membrane protein
MTKMMMVGGVLLAALFGATLWAAHTINTASLPSPELADRNVLGKTTGPGRNSLASPQ